MRPSEHHHLKDNETPSRRKDYSLFFFERQGNRSYLRFTRLGVTVILLITVVPLILFLIAFMVSSHRMSSTNVNTSISIPTPFPMPTIIKQPTPRPPPKIRQQPIDVPNPLRETSNVNSNKQPPPQQPQPRTTPPGSNRSANYQ